MGFSIGRKPQRRLLPPGLPKMTVEILIEIGFVLPTDISHIFYVINSNQSCVRYSERELKCSRQSLSWSAWSSGLRRHRSARHQMRGSQICDVSVRAVRSDPWPTIFSIPGRGLRRMLTRLAAQAPERSPALPWRPRAPWACWAFWAALTSHNERELSLRGACLLETIKRIGQRPAQELMGSKLRRLRPRLRQP